MKLTARHIDEQQFRRTLLGWDPREVKAFLGEVAGALRDSDDRCADLARRLAAAEAKAGELAAAEERLRASAASAGEEAGKAIESARREAQLLLQEAERQAASVLEQARADQLRLKEQITILASKKESILRRLKLLLNTELDLVKALESADDLGADAGTPELPAKTSAEIEEILRSLEQS